MVKKGFSLGEMLRFCSENGGGNIQRFCPTCEEETDMTQQYRIDNFPQILCIQLERGQYDKTGRNQSPVDFPVDNFQPHQYFEPNNESVNDIKYYLFAVVTHEGRHNSEGGHYTAICRQDVGGTWFQYDDDEGRSRKDYPVTTKQMVLYCLKFRKQQPCYSIVNTIHYKLLPTKELSF
jgi:ubiquitin C-terminal hydrolase